MYTQDLIAQIAQRYGVPIDIALAVAQQESGFNQAARGSSGEVGMYQLMPGTANELGVDPYILEQNIEGGIRYLRQQYDRFGNWADALAAYNAGASRVAGGKIPASTKGYVESVLAIAGDFGQTIREVFIPDTGVPTFRATGVAEAGFPWWVLAIGLGAIVWRMSR